MKKVLKNKKGFTLVEIIVVLVIMAILAGAGIPALLGFIDDAKGKADVAEARAAYVAAQSIAAQEYAVDPTTVAVTKAEVETLAGITANAITVNLDTTNKGKVTSVVFKKTSSGKTITISGSGAATIQ